MAIHEMKDYETESPIFNANTVAPASVDVRFIRSMLSHAPDPEIGLVVGNTAVVLHYGYDAGSAERRDIDYDSLHALWMRWMERL